MIDAMSVLSPSVEVPQRTEQTSKQNEGRDNFIDVMSSVPASDEKEPKTKIDDTQKPDSDDKRDEAEEMSIISIYERLCQQIAALDSDKTTAASGEVSVTGVLEGKGVLSDTDIAFLSAEAKSLFDQLSGEEKEAIMARMPQLKQRCNRKWQRSVPFGEFQ